MKKILNLKMLMGILVMCIILTISTISKAYSAGGDLTSSSKLEAGKDVKVTLTIKNIDADDGIRSITVGKINYDTNVFEAITASSFVGENGWSATYSANSGKLAIINGNPMTANNAVVTLTLKAKQAITDESTTIKFENIVVASSSTTTGNISVGTKNVTIYANKDSQSGSETPKTDPTSQPSTTPGTSKKNTTKNITTSKTKSTKLPKAGDASTIAIASVAVILLIIAIVGFTKYTKQKDIK